MLIAGAWDCMTPGQQVIGLALCFLLAGAATWFFLGPPWKRHW